MIVSALVGADVEFLADLLRTCNDEYGVQVAYKAFYSRLARLGGDTGLAVFRPSFAHEEVNGFPARWPGAQL